MSEETTETTDDETTETPEAEGALPTSEAEAESGTAAEKPKPSKNPATKAAVKKAEAAAVPQKRPVDGDGVKVFPDTEMSAYRAAIDALDDFSRAMGGIPSRNYDSELRALLNQWAGDRAGVLERYNRLMSRKEE